ncbi:mobilization relaxase component [Micromonospora chokoriensis]|uniref:mobilization relaxase component n=1 Tax=Micromonospora chokoriensis TaxID=356851 RepID=UPI0004C2B718|nr:mobilization relaxase component [Micromonospora chokoriensis]
MITRVHRRGSRVGGLLRYLWGPGKAEEHTNPHLVAAWDGAGPLTHLEPKVTASGRLDLRGLTAMLEQPVRAGYRPPTKFVWHASMRLAPEDRHRTVSDTTWANMAVQMLTEVGVATTATDPGLRWIAMRHADDHVHIVATLVREDGRTNWLRHDYPRCVKATYNVARRYNLHRRVPPADRTAHRSPHPAEVSKARRAGRAHTPRDELRRRVRTAVAAAGSQEEFFARLREAGILVRLRRSSTDPRQITGYAVALPGARTAGGQPVYFGGGRLAPDMTLPKLRLRWGTPTPLSPTPTVGRAERVDAMRQAAKVVTAAADDIRRDAHAAPGRAQATAVAAADLLTSLASAVEGDRRGPLHRAAEVFDRAARELYGQIRKSTSRSQEMRAMSRLVALMGRVSGEDDVIAALALVMDLARLADTLEQLRNAQQRLHQAEAARSAAAALRLVAGGRQRTVTLPLTATSTPVPTVGGGRRTVRGR